MFFLITEGYCWQWWWCVCVVGVKLGQAVLFAKCIINVLKKTVEHLEKYCYCGSKTG